MSEWKNDLANALGASTAQAESCEAQFVNGLKIDLQDVAGVVLNQLLERGKAYIACRFGGLENPQAQAAWGDLASIIAQCGTANLSKLLTGGFNAYAAAVGQCVLAKLLGGGVIGIGGNASGFQEREVHRCGG